MKDHPDNIDELLNAFLDGELSVRQQTEVQRLMANDPKLGQRLEQFRKCKMFIGSLPHAEAPEGMSEDIKGALARRTLLSQQPAAFRERAGAKQLMMRKVLAAAAMIALMAVLSTVVYTIVAPEQPPVARPGTGPESPRPIVAMPFNGRLELTTAAFKEVDSSINRAIEGSGLVERRSLERLGDRTVYVLTCGREGLSGLLDRLEENWMRFDSATLFVETKTFGEPVAVGAVTPGQIAEITNQATFENSVRVAKDLAVINNMAEQLRSKMVIVAGDKSPDFMTNTIPRLTQYERPAETITGEATINLTIMVVAVK